MIVSRSGEVLTNNHVINGATTFKVVDVTSHHTYTATVVGYSVSRDVAVLQLANASGLHTIKGGGAIPLRVGKRSSRAVTRRVGAGRRRRRAAGSSPSTSRSSRRTTPAIPRR